MPVRCIADGRRQHEFSDFAPGADVLLFDPRLERGIEKVGDRFRRIEPARREVDLIILRGSDPDFAAAVEADPILPKASGGTPVVSLAASFDARALEPQITVPSWSPEVADVPSLDDLRALELLGMLHASRAVMHERDAHFLLPSASFHAEKFVRLADAIGDQTDLIRLSDWLLPHLGPETAIAADTGSLLGLANAVAHQAQLRFGWKLPVATLNEYPVRRDAIREVIDRFRARNWERLLFLVSVNSSGVMAQTVRDLDGIDATVISLLETRQAIADDVPYFARYPIDRWDVDVFGRCERCPDYRLLAIDPQTYELRTRLRLDLERPDTKEALRCKPFWEAASRKDAVRLHVDTPLAVGHTMRSRHLAVWLDVSAILGDEEFRGRCLDVLSRIPRPELVLMPTHGTSDALRELLCEAYALEEDDVVSLPLGPFDASIKERICQAQTILLADDALITGNTLTAMRDRVFECTQGAGRDTKVWGFVPISRPAWPSEERRVKNRFGRVPAPEDARPTHSLFNSVEQILLPDGAECPWCRERKLLEDRLANLEGEAEKTATRRLAQLRTSSGLEEPVLLGDPGGLETIGSFFGDLSTAPAFAAASALGRKMKVSFEQDRAPGEVRILDSPLIAQAFYDPVLVAGLLRTLERSNMRDAGHDDEVRLALEGDASVYRVATLVELAYAAIEHKLPGPPVESLLERRSGEPEVDLMRALIALS